LREPLALRGALRGFLGVLGGGGGAAALRRGAVGAP